METGRVRCARLGSATSSTRQAQLLRTRTDAGTVDQPTKVETCSRPVLGLRPEAKAYPGTTCAPAKIRVDDRSCRRPTPRFVVSSTKFHPGVQRFHVPANNSDRPLEDRPSTFRRVSAAREPSVLAMSYRPLARELRPFHLKYAAPQAGSYVPLDNWVSSLEAVPHGSRAHGARRAPHRAEQTSSIKKTRRVLGDAGSAELWKGAAEA